MAHCAIIMLSINLFLEYFLYRSTYILLLVSITFATEWMQRGVVSPSDHLYSMYNYMDFNVTVASQRAERVSDAPGIITVYNREDILRNQWQTLEEILMNTPGFFLHPYLSGYKNSISARGNTRFYGNKVLFLFNGGPVRQASTGTGYAELLFGYPTQWIKRVEIIRGPGSVLYGTGAYDGVVSVITQEAPEHTNSQYEVGFDAKSSWQQYSASAGQLYLHHSQRIDKCFFKVGYSLKEDSGDRIEGKISGLADTTHLFWKNQLITLGSQWGNWSLDGWVSHGETPASSTIKPITQRRALRSFANLGWDHTSSMWTYKTSITYNSNQIDYTTSIFPPLEGLFDFSIAAPLLPLINADSLELKYDFPSNVVKGSGSHYSILTEASVLANPKPNLNFLMGVAMERAFGEESVEPTTMDYSVMEPWVEVLQNLGQNKLASDLQEGLDILPKPGSVIQSLPFYKYTSLSLYLQGDYRPIPELKLIVGTQINKPEGIDPELTPRLGVIWNLHPNWGVKLNYAQAFRNPSPLEQDGIMLIRYPNPKRLKPEKVTTSDAELFAQYEHFVFSGSVWNSIHRDRIDVQGIDTLGGHVIMFQVKNATIVDHLYGYDLTIGMRLPQKLQLSASFSDYFLGKNTLSSYAPRKVLHLRSFHFFSNSWGWGLHYSGFDPSYEDKRLLQSTGNDTPSVQAVKQYRFDRRSHVVGGDLLWKYHSSLRLPIEWQAGLYVRNLLNQSGYADGGGGFLLPYLANGTLGIRVSATY
jgi:outer membrane cobalamin receptor